MTAQVPHANPDALVEYHQQWCSLLRDHSEQLFKKDQRPNDRLNTLITLQDKLNESLAEAIRLASAAQNANIPISRLPSEVFLYICELACPWKNHRSVLNVIALTHVCRRWRDVLLSYPIIWSHIYVLHNSPKPLINTLLQRSQGVPLAVNIRYISYKASCFCTTHPAWEDGDYCPHEKPSMVSLHFLEPLRTRIHTLNVRYLWKGSYGGHKTMEDILNVPFFFGSFPNLESLRWSCRSLGGMDEAHVFALPRKLFESSLPRLQKLSMVNCWGLTTADTPELKAMSMESTVKPNQAEIPANHLLHWLRRRQSLVSLSLTSCRIVPNVKSTPDPVPMENLKEITLRRVTGGVMYRYIRCPSIHRITTLRIAPFTQDIWIGGMTTSVTATDGLGGSATTEIHLPSDTSLAMIWEAFALVFQHSVTTLEVEDLHSISHGATTVSKLIDVLPDLHTIRVQMPLVAKGFEVLREILSGKHAITRVERLVGEAESLDETRGNDEKWEALCIEHKLRHYLA